MKQGIVIILSSMLFACTAATPMAELEAQALQSGDWSQVEKRERQLARRRARNGGSCPGNATNVCVKRTGDFVCQCVDQSSVQGLLSGRPW